MVAETVHGNIAKTACDTVFNIIGNFDRGMVYKFHDDLSGEVIHEIRADCVESSYLGLRFPMSDIPLLARKLYIANGVRYIKDVDAEDVPVVSKQGVMDLTQIRMRAVAKPHIVYLRNMGVKCSMSLAIIVENELWGLLAFHGYNHSYKPSLHQRIACETISTIMSVRIEATIKIAQSQRIIKLGESMMSLKPERGVIHNLFDREEGLLEIIGADTLVGYVQGKYRRRLNVLPSCQIFAYNIAFVAVRVDAREGEGDSIVLGDQSLVPSDTFWARMVIHPDRELCIISDRDGIAALGLSEKDCPAAGIVYFRQGRTHIMLGRSTRSKDVKWAGDPDTPKLRVGGILNPRSSFETFIEKARNESQAWSTEDINVISVLRDRICENAHTCMLALLRGDMEKTNERYLTAMDRARDNFEFFAHMSHEVRGWDLNRSSLASIALTPFFFV
jgi:light-regulated signal transduction histidine kinase (bacteriophytochrome)